MQVIEVACHVDGPLTHLTPLLELAAVGDGEPRTCVRPEPALVSPSWRRALPLTATAADYARTLAFEKTVDQVAAMVEEQRPLDELRATLAPLGLDYSSPEPAPSRSRCSAG